MKIDLTLGAIEHQQFHTIYHKVHKHLLKTTKLDYNQIQLSLITYYKFAIANGKRVKKMTRNQLSTFFQVYLNVTDTMWLDQLISYIDPNSKSTISAESFVRLMELWTFGNLHDQIKLCFGVYDVHGTGFITRETIRKYCRNSVSTQSQDETEELVAEYVDFLIRRFDTDRDGKISFEDYSKTVEESPLLLEFLGPVIPNMANLHAIFVRQ